jgi:hypothetical protein
MLLFLCCVIDAAIDAIIENGLSSIYKAHNDEEIKHTPTLLI